MPSVKRPAIGRHLTAITVRGYSVSGGTLTLAGSAVSIAGQKKGLRHSLSPSHEEINNDQSVVANNVIILDDQSLEIDVFLVNDGTDPSPLKTLLMTYDYFLVSWSIGTGTSARNEASTLVRGPYSFNSTGRGAMLGTVAFLGCDVDSGYHTSAAP